MSDTAGLVYLRARWYHSGHGTFTTRDPFEGIPEQPYSLHPYQYGYSDPARNTDPTGRYADDDRGGSITTWDEFLYAYGSRYDFPTDRGPGQWSHIEVGGTSPATAARFARAYAAYLANPESYAPGTETYRGAYIFAIYFLHLPVFPPPVSALAAAQHLLSTQAQRELTPQENCDLVTALLVLGFRDPQLLHAADDGRGSGGTGSSSRPGLDAFPEWKLGDPITKLTSKGEYPKWFGKTAAEKIETIQGKYWMNRASKAEAGEFTARQFRQMRAGFAPEAAVEVRNLKTGVIEIRTVSKELHHAVGNRGVPPYDNPAYLREVWPWEHASLDQHRRLGYEFIRFISR